jgi:hypothetical protein
MVLIIKYFNFIDDFLTHIESFLQNHGVVGNLTTNHILFGYQLDKQLNKSQSLNNLIMH